MRTAASTPQAHKTWQLAISCFYVYQLSNKPGLYCHVCRGCIAHQLSKDFDTMDSWPNEFSPELHFEPPLTG